MVAFVAVMLFVYVVLLGVTTSGATTWLPLIGGALGGLWWNGKTTKLTLQDGRVLGAKTLWVLMPWAISMSLTQGLALAESSLTVPVGFTMLFAVSGLVFGENVGLLDLDLEPPLLEEEPEEADLPPPPPPPPE